MSGAYLYLDTSDHLIVGLLNSSFEWLEFSEISGAKNSRKIHGAIHEILCKHSIEPLSLLGIIQNAGPGSYTGMRVSEGLSQLFEWKGVNIFSFYHFEVPRLLGTSKGFWVAKAFKSEFFLYSWDGIQESKKLLSKENLKVRFPVNFLSTHFISSLEKDFSGEELRPFVETGALIKSYSKELFSFVTKRKDRLGPYYFRSLDQEFKASL